MLLIWRTLFVTFLLYAIVFFSNNYNQLVIDTNLREISPNLDLDSHTLKAVDDLADNISKRVIFMVSGEDPEAVSKSVASLSKALATFPAISVLSSSSIKLPKLIESLSKHRFHLLTDKQQKQLLTPKPDEIAAKAQAAMFSLSNAPLIPFEQDPIGWHSEYVTDLLKKISSDVNVSTSVKNQDDAGKLVHHQVIQLIMDRSKLNFDGQTALVTDLDRISNELVEKNGVQVRRSGSFFFAVSEATKSKKDISFISTVSMIGVFIILLFMFRTVWPIILPFVSIAAGVTFAFAVSHTLYGKVHIITILFGASLIGIVIDYSIHYFFHHAEHMHDEVDHHDILKRKTSDKRLHNALLLSLVTSLLGYSALTFSDLGALKKVAVFSCCGLVMAWLSVICLGHFASKKIVIHQGIITKLLAILKFPLQPFVTRHVWVFIVLLFAAAIFVTKNLNTSDDPRFFFKPDKALIANEVAVAKVASAYEPGRFVIINADSADKLYQYTSTFFDKVEAFDGLEKSEFMSITNWIPSLDQQRQNYDLQKNLYLSDGALDKLVPLLGLEASMVDKLRAEYQQSGNNLLKVGDLTEMLKEVLPPIWSQSESNYNNFILIARDIDFSAVDQLTSDLDNTLYFDMVRNAKEVLEGQRVSASQLLLVAYFLIGILLYIRYRQVAAIYTLLIPLCSTAALIVVLFLFGNVFSLFHVMALFLVLGLGMDYSIFTFEMRGREATRNTTQHAILISSITSLISFGLMGLSSIPVAQNFGIVLFLGNVFNLFFALIYTDILHKAVERGLVETDVGEPNSSVIDTSLS